MHGACKLTSVKIRRATEVATVAPMASAPRRLNEADANFVVLGQATGAAFAPIAVGISERPYDDPELDAHLAEVMSRLIPAMRQRVVRDRFSTALHRWEDVPGFRLEDHRVRLPPPGDGTLRAVLDWAQEWGRTPMPLDRPPWRSARFEGVVVDGVPGRVVEVSQFHHALIDGQGASRLAQHFYQWAPDGGAPELPPAIEPDRSTPGERWRQGWALEGRKARELTRATGRRLRWAATHPAAGWARAKDYAAAAGRMQAESGDVPRSPLLVRTSDRNRFDHVRVDLDALRAGARALGGSANDGFLAAVSLALHRWHADHGVQVPALRTAMAISTRKESDGHLGNELIAAIMGLPLLDTVEVALKECQAVSRAHRDDRDVLFLMDRFRAFGNRLPRPVVARLFGPGSKGFDLSLSNVKGIPLRHWIAGVETLDSLPFLVGGPAVAATLVSLPTHANLGVATCPEAVRDPERLMDHLDRAIREVAALAP